MNCGQLKVYSSLAKDNILLNEKYADKSCVKLDIVDVFEETDF